MSVSLVKKSLNLIESSHSRKGSNQTLKQPLELKSGRSSIKGNNSKSKGIKKKYQNVNFVKNLEKIHKHIKKEKNQDKTKLNLQKLKILEGRNVENSKILEFFKRATKSKEIKIEKKEEKQSTVFTEEDFAKFEREYEFD